MESAQLWPICRDRLHRLRQGLFSPLNDDDVGLNFFPSLWRIAGSDGDGVIMSTAAPLCVDTAAAAADGPGVDVVVVTNPPLYCPWGFAFPPKSSSPSPSWTTKAAAAVKGGGRSGDANKHSKVSDARAQSPENDRRCGRCSFAVDAL